MKFLLLLLFAFSIPTAVFLSTLLYASDTNIILKQELSHARVYDKANEFLINSTGADESSQEFNTILNTVLTPSYLQEKTESTIDLSYIWITNKSTTPPSISFIEIKEAVLAQNPQLLNQIDSFAEEAKNDPMMESNSPDQKEMQKSIDSLVTLAHSDFVIKLDTYLIGLKNTYNTLRIALPILIIIILAELLLIAFLCKTWESRSLWIGLTFLLSGLHGFGVIFVTNSLMNSIPELVLKNTNEELKLFSPIIIEVTKHFVNTYVKYQTYVSVIFIIAGVLCLIGYFYLRFAQKKEVQAIKPKKKK